MMIVKRFVLILAVVGLVAGLSVGTMAQCASTKVINNTNGWQNIGAGGLGTTTLTKFWQVGSAATANSGTLALPMATAYSTGYYVATNWANTGVIGCPCPGGVCGTNRTAFLYSRQNGGTGQYVIMSVANGGLNRYNMDDITNGPGNILLPRTIPTLSVTSAVQAGANYVAQLTWTPIPVAQLKGYYDAAPTNNIITGVAIRYFNGAAPPAAFGTGSWTLCTNGTVNWGVAGTDPGAAANVTFPVPAGGTRTYLAMSILFDGQVPTTNARGEALGLTESAFMGGYVQAVFAPTPAGLFVRNDVSARNGMVTVDWTTNVESAVASYQVFYTANKNNGPWTPITSTMTQPKGSNSNYSVTFDKPVKGQKLFYKVGANMTDGSTQWSDILKIAK